MEKKKNTLYSQLQSHCKNFEMTSKPEKTKKDLHSDSLHKISLSGGFFRFFHSVQPPPPPTPQPPPHLLLFPPVRKLDIAPISNASTRPHPPRTLFLPPSSADSEKVGVGVEAAAAWCKTHALLFLLFFFFPSGTFCQLPPSTDVTRALVLNTKGSARLSDFSRRTCFSFDFRP